MGGDKIVVIPERVRRLADRLKAWVRLRRTEARNRKIAILVSGHCPYRNTIKMVFLCDRIESDVKCICFCSV